MLDGVLLSGKVGIITGSTGTLGRVVTGKFLENGATVVALYRSEEKKDILLESLEGFQDWLTTVKGDASREDEIIDIVKETFVKHGRIDFLLNIVGGYRGGQTIAETSLETWDHLMNLNMKTAFILSKTVIPYMLQQNYGRIVCVSSKSGVENWRRIKSGAYAISKAGVKVLTEVLALETKGTGVNVNCIAPSVIDSPENRRSMPRADYSKWVSPEEIADVILFLASEDSSPTSGALVPVYGNS